MVDYDPSKPEPWHISRSIPVAIIMAIVVQTGGAVYYAGHLAARIDNIETAANANAKAIAFLNKNGAQTDILLARLEERLVTFNALLSRVERKIDGNPPK